ncbi:MAG TPA: hypothetical protein VF177_04510 [Anaerolineae bacterium]
MSFLSFQNYPVWANLAIFAVAAAIIWFAGTRLERYTNAISIRTGLGKAFLGLLLLGTVTSLPEIATTVTATPGGNVDLALHNLLGGVVMQTAVLAIVDIAIRKGSLTRFTPKFVLLIEGVGLVQVLAAALLTMALAGRVTVTLGIQNRMFTIGLGPLALFIIFLVMMYMTHRSQGYPRWQPVETSSETQNDVEQSEQEQQQEQQEKQQQEERKQKLARKSLSKLSFYVAIAALAVLMAGWTVATVGEVLSEQTGLGSSFIGFTNVTHFVPLSISRYIDLSLVLRQL